MRFHAADTLLRYAGRRREADAYPRIFRAISADLEGEWSAIAGHLAREARAKLPS